MTTEIKVENLNAAYAEIKVGKKPTAESLLYAEIISQIHSGADVFYIEFYNTVPAKLGISKDAYRKAMASLKKKNLIGKKGYTITLIEESIKQPFNQIIITNK